MSQKKSSQTQATKARLPRDQRIDKYSQKAYKKYCEYYLSGGIFVERYKHLERGLRIEAHKLATQKADFEDAHRKATIQITESLDTKIVPLTRSIEAMRKELEGMKEKLSSAEPKTPKEIWKEWITSPTRIAICIGILILIFK